MDHDFVEGIKVTLEIRKVPEKEMGAKYAINEYKKE